MINWYLKMPEDSGLREKCRRDLHDFAVENVDFALSKSMSRTACG